MKHIVPGSFKQSAAFLKAAMKLDPNEPRYARMLYEAMLQLHDNQVRWRRSRRSGRSAWRGALSRNSRSTIS